MKEFIILSIILPFLCPIGIAQNIPYPNHTAYTENHIKPNNHTQSQLDSHTSSFYDNWKDTYLKNDCGSPNQYYIYSNNGSSGINVSEAQGYGMVITAFMAGFDNNAQTYFDGLFNFFKAHPSNINPNLMDWQQITCSDTPSPGDDSASDGDIDIAFGLLLADAQWGSNGAINYLQEATTMINAIFADEINQDNWSVKLGDWSNISGPNFYYSTRTSDFIIDHFKAFGDITGNPGWDKVVNTCYSLVQDIQTNHSPVTGLLPDFIINVNTTPGPANPNLLEGGNDGDYYYNACRTPWRLGVDYLVNGDPRAGTAIKNINSWLISTTSSQVGNISNGYKLNGTAIHTWNDPAFIGPFTVGAMADPSQQEWLNNLYGELTGTPFSSNDGYYSNTLKMLSMITISGNYWVPGHHNSLNPLEINEGSFRVIPNPAQDKIQITGLKMGDTIEIMDVSGKIYRTLNLPEGSATIEVPELPTAMYFVKVTDPEGVVSVQKVIVE
ncbi:MAG: beta-glucanase [Maribacter sp.]|nr:MAG: beta-glucanase [Maribacter sp.]